MRRKLRLTRLGAAEDSRSTVGCSAKAVVVPADRVVVCPPVTRSVVSFSERVAGTGLLARAGAALA